MDFFTWAVISIALGGCIVIWAFSQDRRRTELARIPKRVTVGIVIGSILILWPVIIGFL